MAKRRISYCNWIVDDALDCRVEQRGEKDFAPVLFDEIRAPSDRYRASEAELQRQAFIAERVTLALENLGHDERELIERLHFAGQTYREISELSGRPVHRLEALHRRGMRKLRKLLQRFVEETFQVSGSIDYRCPICASPDRATIDELILSRDRSRSWRPVLRQLAESFGLKISSPMTLIGHEKYHGAFATTGQDTRIQVATKSNNGGEESD